MLQFLNKKILQAKIKNKLVLKTKIVYSQEDKICQDFLVKQLNEILISIIFFDFFLNF